MKSEFWTTLWLTFELSALVTATLIVIGLPLAYILAYSKSRFKPVFEALISMPLVLPPTVLGFYLLIALGPGSSIGKFLNSTIGVQLVFTFTGLWFASVIYSLPFMIHPLQSGFQKLPLELKEASYSLGKSRFITFIRVLLPNMKPAILTGIVLSFAHTIGEFGVVLMIGGNIPGQTKLASIAIYDAVESLNYATASQYAFVLFTITFIILLGVYFFNQRIVRVQQL